MTMRAEVTSTADTPPAVARRAWPWWVAGATAMLALAVVAVVRVDLGPRLLLAATGVFLLARGLALLGGARSLPRELAGRAVLLGTACVVAGTWAFAVSVLSLALWPGLGGWVLLVLVPLLLLLAGLGLLARGGLARRGGQGLLVWAALVAGLLVVTGLGQGWDRAASVATVVAAVGLAVGAVALLVGAADLRAVGARPEPEPAVSAGCAGCASSGGGCGIARSAAG